MSHRKKIAHRLQKRIDRNTANIGYGQGLREAWIFYRLMKKLSRFL